MRCDAAILVCDRFPFRGTDRRPLDEGIYLTMQARTQTDSFARYVKPKVIKWKERYTVVGVVRRWRRGTTFIPYPQRTEVVYTIAISACVSAGCGERDFGVCVCRQGVGRF